MRPAAADPLERRPLRRAEPPLHEQVPVRDSSPTFCLIRFLRRAARLAAFELGRAPRQFGGTGCQTLAFLGHGERIALFTSCRMWNWQT